MAYVYILKCVDGSYYTGSTVDIEKRIKAHVLKLPTAAKYTRSHTVVDVSAIWEAPSLSFACKLEYFIKRKLSHAQKQQIVSTPEKLKEYIPEHLKDIEYRYFGTIEPKRILKSEQNDRQN